MGGTQNIKTFISEPIMGQNAKIAFDTFSGDSVLLLDDRVVNGELTVDELKEFNKASGAKEDNLTLGKYLKSKPLDSNSTEQKMRVGDFYDITIKKHAKRYNRWYNRLGRKIKSWVK